MNKERREKIELSVMGVFSQRRTARLLTKELFQRLPQYANSDMVRAFEDLEKTKRLIVRYTADGNDWISLTTVGIESVGLQLEQNESLTTAHPHPPRSSTQAFSKVMSDAIIGFAARCEAVAMPRR